MERKAVILFVISITSMPISDLLYYMDVLSENAARGFWMLSMILFLYASYKLLIDFDFESKYFKFIFSLFLVYEFVTVFRGFSFTYSGLVTIFRESQNFWPFVIPLFVLFDKRFSTLVVLINWIFRLALVFLISVICLPDLLLTRMYASILIPALAIACGFLLLNATYLSNRKINISFLVMFLSALSLTYFARRSTVITLLGFIIFSYFLNVFNKSRTLLFRLFPLFIGLGVFVILNFEDFSNGLFEKMSKRIFEDSRSTLYEMFFIQMEDSMVFGKGMNGNYYFPMDEADQGDGIVYGAEEYRNIIENGYLQLLLTGGIVHIVLFALVLLPAAINGIFKSSNQFTQACGFIILLWLLDMFIYGLPTLSLSYILVWICVGICYKKSFRKKTNEEIRIEFQKRDLSKSKVVLRREDSLSA